MKNNNYNINDFRTVPIEMTPTYAIEREYAARSILDDRDEYDEALLAEIERRHKCEEGDAYIPNYRTGYFYRLLPTEFLESELSSKYDKNEESDYIQSISEELERRKKLSSRRTTFLRNDFNNGNWFSFLPTERLEREYMARSVLDERDEYDESLLDEINRRRGISDLGFSYRFLNPSIQRKMTSTKLYGFELPEDYEFIYDVDELVAKIIDLKISIDSQISIMPMNYDNLANELKSYSLEELNLQYYYLYSPLLSLQYLANILDTLKYCS